MPSDGSEEVGADYSATETPAEGTEAADEAGSVEQTAPSTADPVAEDSRNWADLSEVFGSTAASDQVATAELVPVKEEEQELQEAQSLGAVLSTIGLPEEVADEPVAMEESALDFEQPLDQPFLEEQPHTDNPAEAAFTDIDRAKEEQQDPEHSSPVPSPEQAECEVETTDILGLGTEASPVGVEAEVEAEGPPAEASEAAVASEPLVADTSGVATEANTTCPGDIVPPPTSPNLVEPGTDPIQVGHSPATSSNPPRQRVRSSRGGATTRWQEAKRAWWNDFEAYQNWLYRNSGGDIAGGFWLRKISYEQADESTRWLIALHSRLVEEFTTSQCLTLAYNILLPYKEWAHYYGLDRRRGTAHAQQVIDSGDLPPKRVINQRILGAEHPRAEEWDIYIYIYIL